MKASMAPQLFTKEYSDRCLQEITALARKKHSQLRPLHPAFKQGGCLLLGHSYARSRFIYCGLNPGRYPDIVEHDFLVEPASEAPYNLPFVCDVKDPAFARLPYWRNAHNFFNANGHQDLRDWFQAGVTSTFLSPWRTGGLSDINKLPGDVRKRLHEYSRDLLEKMIEHHDAKVLITAGVSSIDFLSRLTGKVNEPEQREGSGKTYQWSECSFSFVGRKIMVLQIPHFSRANSKDKMEPFARWLRDRLKQVDPPPSDCSPN
jgi:hypothetical protein